ncbi:MAG TPA: type II secretion system protein M [Gammaproteobacteria bacterium]|nr:type II secretion system protein M [Gammaproteobacteria bacterium]
MNGFRAWFMGLDQRERRILVVGAALATVLLAYLLIWQPLHGNLVHLRSSVEEQRSTLQWMEHKASEVQALRAADQRQGQGSNGQSLLALVDQSARKSGLGGAISRIEPEAAGSVRVWMDDVSFDDAVLWLGQLQNTYGVRTQVVSVENQDSPGRVNVRITLQGASQ